MAAALGITMPTLRKYYFRELRVKADARARLDAKAVDALLAQVEAGNASAIALLFKRIDRLDLLNATITAKPVKLGKKDQARINARQVPRAWGELVN